MEFNFVKFRTKKVRAPGPGTGGGSNPEETHISRRCCTSQFRFMRLPHRVENVQLCIHQNYLYVVILCIKCFRRRGVSNYDFAEDFKTFPHSSNAAVNTKDLMPPPHHE